MRASRVGLLLACLPIVVSAQDDSDSNECVLHWNDETTADDWKDFFRCANDLYEACDRRIKIRRKDDGDHVDLIASLPEDCQTMRNLAH